ncbi:MAG: ABC transporter substrate-binding protein [Clostridia bacterium]|nr:ABC transporter substrate-binding protein [Clostridia bacterium]
MKKTLSFLIALMISLSFAAPCFAAETATRTFTDSCGRAVEIPETITKVAVSGPLAQIVLFPLCADLFVGTASDWTKEATRFIPERYLSLPQLGQLYGGKGDLNPESLLASGAEIVIDIGEPKKSIREDMDNLTEQTGIPFVHIDAYTATMGDTYRMLGDLTGRTEKAETLAAYCDEIYARALDLGSKTEKVSVLYLTGIGQNVIAKGSYHAELLDMMADNLAVVESPSGKGTGNEVSPEQLLLWDPAVLLVAPGAYEQILGDPVITELTAVRNGFCYEVPNGPYNWMGFPPSVQRLLGVLWLGTLLYPETVDYDLFTEVHRYFALFYEHDLTEAEFAELTARSLPVAEKAA